MLFEAVAYSDLEYIIIKPELAKHCQVPISLAYNDSCVVMCLTR